MTTSRTAATARSRTTAKPKAAPGAPAQTAAARPAAIVKPRTAVKPANGAKKMSVPAKPSARPAASRPVPPARSSGTAGRPGTPLSTVTRTSDSGDYRDMLAGLIR